MNGLLLVIEHCLTSLGWRYPRNLAGSVLRRATVLSAICLGWIFFRAQSLHAAIHIITKIATQTSFSKWSVESAVSQFAGDIGSVAICASTLLLIAVMFAIEFGQEYIFSDAQKIFRTSLKYQFAATVVLFQLIMLFGILRASAFIYFQF